METPYDIATEMTPESIVELIFSDTPKDPNHIVILPYSNEMETDVITFNFELLLTIYMEAIVDAERLGAILQTHEGILSNGSNKKINIEAINKQVLCLPQPWFNSFCYFVRIYEEPVDEYFVKPTDYYCRIVLKDNLNDHKLFNFSETNKPYHFLLNPRFVAKDNKMESIEAIFYKPKTDSCPETLYTISFSPIILHKPLTNV
jgi:hypothetical protein